ncbi:MAG: signal recognition particle protein [Desulfovibrionales bacterium]
MFDSLSDRLNDVFKKIRGHGRLDESNIKEGLREVRLALLEADVHFKVVKVFIGRVQERAMGQGVLKSLTPGQQVVKIVHEELIDLLGGRFEGLNLEGKPPHVIMLVGLQGSGKTTSAAKLALHLRREKRSPYLVPADVYRPAAIDQLQKLANELSIPAFPSTAEMNPVDISRQAIEEAGKNGRDIVLLDTAGRLHVDEKLMQELVDIKEKCRPQEILFVADAMTGQDAVTVAERFNELLDISGIILTKMEGDARGGAALSIKSVTDKPIKFIGVGERLSDLEVFHPDRVASRILGMGDILTLIEKAQSQIDESEAKDLEKKIQKADFDLEDFRKQMRRLKKLGSLDGLLKMIPGMGQFKNQLNNVKMPEKELTRVEAIINSMTPGERAAPSIINPSRKNRIASGSGTTIQEVNQLLKNFGQMQKMLKKMTKGGMPKGGMPKDGMPIPGGMPGSLPGGPSGMRKPGGSMASLKKKRKKAKKKRKK